MTELIDACIDGNTDLVRDLINKSIAHKALVNVKDEDGYTPLHFAVYKDNIEIVRLLLDFKADPNAQDEDGCTPLHFSAFNENKEICKMLIDRGSDAEIENNLGVNALSVLLQKNGCNLNIVELLNRSHRPD
jgi:ankyrin repeat protein